MPFFHVSGVNTCFLLPLCQGGKVIVLPKWDAKEAVRLIEKEKVTRFWGVPTMSADIVEVARTMGAKMSTLTSLDAGGAKRPPEQVGQIARAFPAVLPATGYGMTETSALGLHLSGQDYIDHPDAAGRLLAPLQDMKIVDDEDALVPQGMVGELALRSAANMRCYLNRPQDTAAVLKDGWMHTGDLVRQDEKGLVFVVDHKKDIIIRGGENIACLEVEAAIDRHGAVKETSVFSVPHERLGETVGVALYVGRDAHVTLEKLRIFLQDALAPFKLPEYLWLFEAPLPRGSTEKIDKRKTRQICLAGNDGDQRFGDQTPVRR